VPAALYVQEDSWYSFLLEAISIKTNKRDKEQIKIWSRDSSGDIGTSYELDGWGSVSGRRKIFLFSTEFIPGIQLTSYPMGTEHP
jgi:hypothetical protein